MLSHLSPPIEGFFRKICYVGKNIAKIRYSPLMEEPFITKETNIFTAAREGMFCSVKILTRLY